MFRAIKQIFDPEHRLNPGKIVGDDADLPLRNLVPAMKTATAPPPAATAAAGEVQSIHNLVELQLDWDPGKVFDAIADCNRCGVCRTQSPPGPHVPALPHCTGEEASPRAKANMLRGVLAGTVGLQQLTSPEFKAIADLCVHCHACRLECPTGVDVPRLMRESKGAYTAANSLTLAEWAMTRLDLLGRAGRLGGTGDELGIGEPPYSLAIGKDSGIGPGRKLPRVTSRSFLRRAARRRLTRPRRGGNKVLYFVDVFANYFDPQLAEAFVAVLEHNGAAVYVPPEQKQAGMPSIARGASIMRGNWPNTTWPCSPRRSGKAITWWPPNRRRRCAFCGNIPNWSMTTTPGSWPPTAARPALSCGTCTPRANSSSISAPCTSRWVIIRPATSGPCRWARRASIFSA